jgi:hypothetical protein
VGDEHVAEGRDWVALVERFLKPFRSEAAAFRVLLIVIVVFGTIAAIALLAKAL